MKKIIYQGIEGSFSYLTAFKIFGKNNKFISANEFKEIFDAVSSKKADYGIIPIENSLAGSVYENFDLLIKYDVIVCGEAYHKVNLNLLGIKTKLPISLRLKYLRKVYSHPKALEQCKKFFEKFPYIEKISFSDTARAAKFVAENNDISLGAIASKECAKIYKLQILKKNLEDYKFNFTRFLIITNKENYKINPQVNKCTLIFILPHIPGSLYKALEIFAINKFNLTKLESRPIPNKPFEYFFFLDFVFNNISPKKVINIILKELSKRTKKLKILGFYKEAKLKY